MIEPWKILFRSIELEFFDRPPQDWLKILPKPLEEIDLHYADRHLLHILILNEKLELFPPLEDDDFDGSKRLRDVMEDFVEPRIQATMVEGDE